MAGKINQELDKVLLKSFQASHDFIALIDSDAQIIWVNDALGAKHGIDPETLEGHHFRKLFDPNLSDLTQEILITIINDGFFHGELLMHGADDSFPATVSASIIPSDTSNDDDYTMLFFASDRTYLKQHEEEARKRREYFGAIISRAPFGIFCLDMDKNLTVINDLMMDISDKVNLNLRLGNSMEEYKSIFSTEIFDVIASGLDGYKLDFQDIPLLVDSKKKTIVNITGTPIWSPDGGIEGIAVLVEDRTEKLLIEEKLREANKLASIGFLATGVAHSVNTPITTIMGNIEFIQKHADDCGLDTKPYELIVANLDRVSKVARSLMDFTRREDAEDTDIDMNAIAKRTVKFFEIQFKWMKLNFVLEENLPTVYGDPVSIEQIVQDIFINAVQAAGLEGTVSISTSFDADSNEVVTRISDSGSGIPEEIMDKIFEPFFTTKDGAKGAEKGTGIGLALSLSTINQHCGTIEVEKTSSKGTVFAIRLPASRK